jgi:hypothetical protein
MTSAIGQVCGCGRSVHTRLVDAGCSGRRKNRSSSSDEGAALSVKVMTWVWEHSRSKLSARLVLLAIADHANGDGVDAFPSMAQLAHKTGLSERGVQMAVAELVRLGELHVSAGGGRGRTNRYRVLMVNPAEDAPFDAGNPEEKTVNSENPAEITVNSVRETPQPATGNPAGSAPGTKREPRATVKNSPTGSSTRTRGTRIPADFEITEPMRTWAYGQAAEVLGREPDRPKLDGWLTRWTAEFVDYWSGRAGREAVKLDWTATWRNRVRTKLDDAARQITQPIHNGHKPSTTDQRVNAAQALKAQMRAIEGRPA